MQSSVLSQSSTQPATGAAPTTKVTRIIKFYSKTCAPCKQLERNIQSSAYKPLVTMVDIATVERDQLIVYGVTAVPTLVFFDVHDNVLGKHTGLIRLELFDQKVESFI